jgi:hypothetical protein
MKVWNLVINEQHTLLENQQEVLKEFVGDDVVNIVKIPKDGLTIVEMKKLAELENIIFVSPIPVTMKFANDWFVFANEKRVKKELPNGKIISVTAQTGWQIV